MCRNKVTDEREDGHDDVCVLPNHHTVL
jgi:hypothetical protein